MSLSKVKQVLFVGVLGFTLVGCSSTPSEEGMEVVSTSGGVGNRAEGLQVAGAPGAGQAQGNELDGQLSAEKNAVEATNRLAELKAALEGKRIHFDFDRSEVKAEYQEIIKLHADYLTLDRQARVTIEGHCDERGTREYNLALGERRANAVKNALIAQGVLPNRINVISFGEDRPLISLSDEQSWEQNRRAEFVY
jgi:peptidoglycan-associated lipoprotein